MLRKLLKVSVITIIIVSAMIAYGQYAYIHKDYMDHAEVTKKEHIKGNYYIIANEKKLKIVDESAWKLIQIGNEYAINYKYYGNQTPKVTEIGEPGTLDSGHY